MIVESNKATVAGECHIGAVYVTREVHVCCEDLH